MKDINLMNAAASSPIGSSNLAHLQNKIYGNRLRGRLLLPAARGKVVSLAPVIMCGVGESSKSPANASRRIPYEYSSSVSIKRLYCTQKTYIAICLVI